MLKMRKTEHCAAIKFFVNKYSTPREIFNEVKNVLDDTGPSFTTVKNQTAAFKHGDASLEVCIYETLYTHKVGI